VERLPRGRHQRLLSHPARSAHPAWRRIVILTGALASVTLIIPAGVAGATSATPGSPPPASLQAKLAQVNKLSNEIDVLGQQYDALRIERTQAEQEAQVAQETAQRDDKLMALGESQIGQIAAAGYMDGSGLTPDIALLQTTNPQQMLNQASIMAQLQQENGDKLTQVTSAQQAAKRALEAAQQEQSQASALTAAMAKKVSVIQGEENQLNSSVYAEALSIFDQTGTYPPIAVTGDSVGANALRAAMTRIGDPYVWAAAGPGEFDCSGLTMWAYAQVGISLEHFTGDQWNEGEHIPYSEAQPGDLIFEFNLDHVGMYVGNGLFLDAPQTGQDVQIQPIDFAQMDGVVRIV
jgi:cell wall-associated NlpC family hydrolase